MRKFFMLIVLLALSVTVFSLAPKPVLARDSTIFEWDTMSGVPKAYTGSRAPIRGINGGGLPWVLTSASGELSAGGKLELRVTGLVLDPNDPDVIARGLAGNNPIAQFKAIVSCQTVDSAGNAAVMNVSTAAVSATTGLAVNGGGNAKIETTLSLPRPCIAPIVFVTNPGGAWFAATGN